MIEVQSRTSCEDLIKEKDKEVGKLVDELEEQERHIKEANAEIEKLNNVIYGIRDRLKQITKSYRPNMSGLYFTVKEFAYCDLDKILNELNTENKSVFDYAYKLEVENNRLNNIINEIEEHFVFLKMNSTGGNKEFFEDILDFIKALKELKGVDKE